MVLTARLRLAVLLAGIVSAPVLRVGATQTQSDPRGSTPDMQKQIVIVRGFETHNTETDDSDKYVPELVAGSTVIKVPIHGGYFEVPRQDLMDIGNFKSSYERDGAAWKYTLQLNAREVQVIAFSADPEVHMNDQPVPTIQPEGWMFSSNGHVWGRKGMLHKPSGEPYSQFVLTSGYRPGLIKLRIASPAATTTLIPSPARKSTIPESQLTPAQSAAEEQKILRARSWKYNSLQKFIIGPAFAPNATAAEIMAQVKTWVGEYRFTFLAPLLSAENPAVQLGLLQPTTDLEKNIVECLWEVLK